MPRRATPWSVRAARKSDQKILSSFRCADPSVSWEVEVEEFIQRDLFDWALEPLAIVNDPRLLLVFHRVSGDFVGVAAHERADLLPPEGASIVATKLEVVAVALSWQGRRFPTSTADGVGTRASDVVMSAAMSDIRARVPPRDARVFAILHEDNLRSRALCERYGFVDEMSRPHPAYLRLITGHQSPGANA